jgi:hypothetical protein
MAPLYLDVPFAEKDEVKKLGARWDPEKKLWFVPERRDPAPFQRWMSPEHDPHEPRSATLIRCGAYLIAQSPMLCWACKTETPLFSFLLPPAFHAAEIADGPRVVENAIALSRTLDPLPPPSDADWDFHEGYRVPVFLNFITADMKASIARLTQHYEKDFSRTLKYDYWMNHCAHCAAKQGDRFIGERYNTATFYLYPHRFDELRLFRGDGPFLALSDSLYGAGLFAA